MHGIIFKPTQIKGFIICIWVRQHLIFFGSVWCVIPPPPPWTHACAVWPVQPLWSSLKESFRQAQLNMRWFRFFFINIIFLFLNSAQRPTPQRLSYGICAQAFGRSHPLMHSKAVLCAICLCGFSPPPPFFFPQYQNIIYTANILSRKATRSFSSCDHHPVVFKARMEDFLWFCDRLKCSNSYNENF